MKPLVCVRSLASAPLGIIEDVLIQRGLPWRYADVWEAAELPAAADMAALIVLGGDMNVDQIDDYPFLGPVRDLVSQALDHGVPVLGICLGAQILTRALGATVAPAPVKEIGFHPVKATSAGGRDDVLAPFAPQATVFQFHEDACSLPAGCELLFEGDVVAVQAYRVVAKPAWAVQFHFEVTEKEITAWADEVPDLASSWGMSKDRLLTQAADCLAEQQQRGRDVAQRFLDVATG